MHLILESALLPRELDHQLLFIFRENMLLIKSAENKFLIPSPNDLEIKNLSIFRKECIGIINGYPCYTAELTEDFSSDNLPKNLFFTGLRQLFGSLDENLFWAAGRAFQIMNWHRTHLFCSRCGTPNQKKTDELAKVCPSCGLLSYPSMAPAIIVAVVKENQILLARNKRSPYKFYSVLAGFVEAGETLEDCVKREVMEEVGIKVKNIRYFNSQPWPFPNSLMIAFTAEYESGSIQADGKEISEAYWFTKDELPEIPGSISIAWHLIQWFINQ